MKLRMEQSRKGITELKRPIIGFLVLLIAIVVVFNAFEIVDDQFDALSYGANATDTMEGAVNDIVGWMPLLALVIVAGVVIAYTSGAFKGV